MMIRHSYILAIFFFFLVLNGEELTAQSSKELLVRATADSSDPKVWYNWGLAFIRERNINLAIEALVKATYLDPKFTDAYFELGKIRITHPRRKFDGIQDLERVVRLNREHKEAYAILGEIYFKQSDFKKSRSYLLFARTLWPENGNIDYYLGKIYYFSSQLDTSEYYLSKAVNLGADSLFDAYLTLGDILTEQSLFDQAVLNYKLALDIKPQSLAVLQKLKYAQEKSRLMYDTIQHANDVLRGTDLDQFTQVHYRLVSLQRNYPKIPEIYQKLREIRKRLSDLWFQKAVEYSTNEQTLKAAMAAYDSSFQYADTDQTKNRAQQGKSIAQAQLGVVQRASDEYKRAEIAFKERLFEEAKKGYITAGKLSPARQAFSEKRQIEIDYFQGLVALQDSFRFDEAKVYFDKVRKQPPSLREAPEFARLENYLEEASKRSEIEKTIVFLQAQATVAIDSSLWSKAKTYLQDLLPLLNEEIQYLNGQKQSASRENLSEKQKIIVAKIDQLERNRADCVRKLQLVSAKLGKINWDLVAIVVTFLMVGIFIGRFYPNLKRNLTRKLFFSETAKESHFNPYVVGQPIDAPEKFFGRESYLEHIQNSIKKHSLLLYGEPRIGKTSILKQLERRLGKPYFVFYTSFQNAPPSDEFFARIMRSLYNRGRADFSAKTQRLKIARNPKVYIADDFQDDLYKILDLLRQLHDQNVIVVMNLDEADCLNDYPLEVLRDLRRLLHEHSRELRMILTGVNIDTTRQDPKSSTLFGFEEKIEVRPLNPKEAEELIRKPVHPFFSYDENAVKYVIEKSDCKPQMIQKICRAALSHLHEEGRKRTRIRLEDVVEVFQKEILREYADEYDKIWESFDKETRIALLDIAKKRVADHQVVVNLLRQTLRDKQFVLKNRLVYFENSHVHIFTPFKEWVMKNAV